MSETKRIDCGEQLVAVVSAKNELSDIYDLMIVQKRLSEQDKADILARLDAAIRSLKWLHENHKAVRDLAKQLLEDARSAA
jgi:putative NADH-flavin reductase